MLSEMKTSIQTKILASLITLLSATAILSCGEDKTAPDKPAPPPPPVETEVIHGSFESKFVRYQEGQKHAGQTNAASISTEWTDTLWRNDRTHKQLVLWTKSKTFRNITYEVSDLTSAENTIPASNVRLRFAGYVTGDATSQTCGNQTTRSSVKIADALFEEPATSLLSSDPLKIWITVDIPKTAAAGKYTGSVTVKDNDVEQQKFDLKFLVVDRTLPDAGDWTFHLDLWQFPYQLASLCKDGATPIVPFTAKYEQLMTPFYTLLADAGQKCITTYIKDGAFGAGQTMIRWTKKTDGSWSFDYSDFETFVTFMISLGIDKQINCFSMMGWNKTIGYYDEATSSSKTLDYDIASADFANIWDTFLTDFKTFLDSRGWFGKTVIYMDENVEAEMRIAVDIIRKNDPAWKIGLAGHYLSTDIENSLYDYSTILDYDRTSSQNTVATFYTSCSQRFPNNFVTLQNSPAEMPWMAWYAAANGLNGYVRWAYDYWTKNDPFNIQDGSNSAGDFNMVYRRNNLLANAVVSSIRFELLREGIQDYEKIRILSNDNLTQELRKFTRASGTNALNLVKNGESMLKKVSVR